LWWLTRKSQLLEPVAERISLHQLAVEDGFVNNIGGVRAYRVGIDARYAPFYDFIYIRLTIFSGWVYRALYRHSATKNPELATLYARCCRLLDKPIRPYFVFDGPKRPSTKRGKHVRGNPHWIERDFQKMLIAFGFPSIVVGFSLCIDLTITHMDTRRLLVKPMPSSLGCPRRVSLMPLQAKILI
jgi:Holliday junction resolvase YEN1